MSVLSDEEARILANMAGLLDNEEAQKRIADIRAAAAEHDKALSRLKVKQAEIELQTREANQKISDAATMAANAEARSRALDKREATMAEVSNKLNAEKAAWEEVRTQVDAEQRAIAGDLSRKAQDLGAWSDKLKAQQRTVDDALDQANRLKAAYEAKHQRLHDALMADEDAP